MAKRVNQKDPSDCAVCAMAMFLGMEYDEIIARIPWLVEVIGDVQTGGLTKSTMMLICNALREEPVAIIHNRIDPDRIKTKQIFKMLKDKPAVMSALSLNVKNKAHAVFWDGKEIVDPSNKKRYTKATITPFEIMF